MKTFDFAKRDVMIEILALYDIPQKIIGTIRAVLTKTHPRAQPQRLVQRQTNSK